MAGCVSGFLLNVVLLAVVSRTNKYVSLYNKTLRELEGIGIGAPTRFFDSADYSTVAQGWGIRSTLRFLAVVGILFWLVMLVYIVNGENPTLFPELIRQIVNHLHRLT